MNRAANALFGLFFAVLLMCCMIGCAQPQKKPVVQKPEVIVAPPPEPVEQEAEEEAVEEPPPVVHTVQWPGESLSIIAAWYTGHVADWKKLAEANPEINPDRIFVGDQIIIPDDILKRREAMTREHLRKFIGRIENKKAPPSEEKEESEKEKEPELFGPKGLQKD